MRLVEAFRVGDPDFCITATPSFSSLTSSDLDSESTFAFLTDKSSTLGTLIGIRTDQTNKRLLSTVHPETDRQFRVLGARSRHSHSAWWSFMRCVNFRGRHDNAAATHSLGHFLQVEKRAAVSQGDEKVYINIMYEDSDGFAPQPNPLFVESLVEPNTFCRGPSDNLPAIVESPEIHGSGADLSDAKPSQTSHSKSQSSCVVKCVSNIFGHGSPANKSLNCKSADG